MPKLHLVGISADRRGLVLSDDPRGSKTELVLEVDQALLSAIAELRRLQTLDTAALSPALPTRRDSTAPSPTRSFHSLLAPREIQQRLRQGVAVETVAAEAGVDTSWVERFAAPVAAEQARVVAQARRAVYLRPRLGPSAEPLDTSVIANALERGARLGLAEVEAGWTAFQRDDGKWTVRFTFEAKGRSQAAEWDFSPTSAELSARNLLASELGHRAAAAPSASRPKAAKPTPIKTAPAKATAASGAAAPEKVRPTRARSAQPTSARPGRSRKTSDETGPTAEAVTPGTDAPEGGAPTLLVPIRRGTARPIGAVFAPPGAKPDEGESGTGARAPRSDAPALVEQPAVLAPAVTAEPPPASVAEVTDSPEAPAASGTGVGGSTRAVQPPPWDPPGTSREGAAASSPPAGDCTAGNSTAHLAAAPASDGDREGEVDVREETGSHQAALFVDPSKDSSVPESAPGALVESPAAPEEGDLGGDGAEASVTSGRAIPDRDSIAAVLVATLSRSKAKDEPGTKGRTADNGSGVGG